MSERLKRQLFQEFGPSFYNDFIFTKLDSPGSCQNKACLSSLFQYGRTYLKSISHEWCSSSLFFFSLQISLYWELADKISTNKKI
jgi:hypothetical protein